MSDTTRTANAYTSARRNLERAASLLEAQPARELVRTAAQICRDLALEAIKPRPEVDVATCNRAARGDAALVLASHTDALVDLAKAERFAELEALAGALAALEGAVGDLLGVAPSPDEATEARRYRLDSARSALVAAEVRSASRAAAAGEDAAHGRHRDASGRFCVGPARPGVRRHR